MKLNTILTLALVGAAAAAPVPIDSPKLVAKEAIDYGSYPTPPGGYGSYPAPAGGYGSYTGAAAASTPATPAGGYGSYPAPAGGYGTYPAPAGGYGSYTRAIGDIIKRLWS